MRSVEQNGFCVPSAVDPAELPPFTGTLPGTIEDAGRDLGPRDSGLDADRGGSLNLERRVRRCRRVQRRGALRRRRLFVGHTDELR